MTSSLYNYGEKISTYTFKQQKRNTKGSRSQSFVVRDLVYFYILLEIKKVKQHKLMRAK
jgi:hypothetical protein